MNNPIKLAILDRFYGTGLEDDIVTPALDPRRHMVVMHTNEMATAALYLLDVHHGSALQPQVIIASSTLKGDYKYGRRPLVESFESTTTQSSRFRPGIRLRTEMVPKFLLPIAHKAASGEIEVELPRVDSQERESLHEAFDQTLKIFHAKHARAGVILPFIAREILSEEIKLIGISGTPESEGRNGLDTLPYDGVISREPPKGRNRKYVAQCLGELIDLLPNLPADYE